MLRVALGFRMHSGWGVAVALDEQCVAKERWRISLVSDNVPGGRQPYHYARELGIEKAERFLGEYIALCETAAPAELARIISALGCNYELAGAGLVLASDRPLPSLPQILSAHPLIHTAEGHLFREVIRRSCGGAGIPVTGIAEKQLGSVLEECFGTNAGKMKQSIERSGRSLGSPWNSDHKQAAIAAAIALHGFTKQTRLQSSGA
jgi:hypothetical protein